MAKELALQRRRNAGSAVESKERVVRALYSMSFAGIVGIATTLGVYVHRIDTMATSRPLRRSLSLDHAVAESMAPQLVESLVGEREGGVSIRLVARALKLLLGFGHEVSGKRDEGEKLEPALVLTELAASLSLGVHLVDLRDDLHDCALVNANIGQAERSPCGVVVDVSQTSARRCALGLHDFPRFDAALDGEGVDFLADGWVGHVLPNQAVKLARTKIVGALTLEVLVIGGSSLSTSTVRSGAGMGVVGGAGIKLMEVII